MSGGGGYNAPSLIAMGTLPPAWGKLDHGGEKYPVILQFGIYCLMPVQLPALPSNPPPGIREVMHGQVVLSNPHF